MCFFWFDRALPAEYQHFLDASIKQIGPAAGTTEDLFGEIQLAAAIIAGTGSVQYSAEVLARASSLKVICRTGIGVDNVDLVEATRRGIVVCNTPNAPSISTAEHTMALLLAVAKKLPAAQQVLYSGVDCDPFNSHDGLELNGLRMGLIGVGRIGSRVARMAEGFGMTVVAYDPHLPRNAFVQFGIEQITHLETLLKKCDVISLHVPLTAETHHLMNGHRIASMKSGGILINSSRGGLVDELALESALRSGHLRGAGLDVFEIEPPPSNHPLLQLENVVATPHLAAATGAAKAKLWSQAITQAIDVLEGRPPLNVVNPEVMTLRRP
jgi:D-3-phosphoglycerate dehydrogenase / 2-oxoglutarate reductase